MWLFETVQKSKGNLYFVFACVTQMLFLKIVTEPKENFYQMQSKYTADIEFLFRQSSTSFSAWTGSTCEFVQLTPSHFWHDCLHGTPYFSLEQRLLSQPFSLRGHSKMKSLQKHQILDPLSPISPSVTFFIIPPHYTPTRQIVTKVFLDQGP